MVEEAELLAEWVASKSFGRLLSSNKSCHYPMLETSLSAEQKPADGKAAVEVGSSCYCVEAVMIEDLKGLRSLTDHAEAYASATVTLSVSAHGLILFSRSGSLVSGEWHFRWHHAFCVEFDKQPQAWTIAPTVLRPVRTLARPR